LYYRKYFLFLEIQQTNNYSQQKSLFLDPHFIIKGIVIGLLVSIPVGPVAVLCIQRVMNKGAFSGFITGAGAAFADVIYAVIAGFGITLIKDFLTDNQAVIRVVASGFLIVIAYKIFMSNPAKQLRKLKREGNKFFSDFATSFLLTISNPLTIGAFGLLYAQLDMVDTTTTPVHVVVMVVSVFAGALLWWLSLVGIVSIFKNRIGLRDLVVVNKITGVLIGVFAVFVVASVAFPGLTAVIGGH